MIINRELTPLLLVITNLILISKAVVPADANNSTCNRSCGEGESVQVVNYPFGFSDGCEIQLNCSTQTRTIHLAGYEVKNLTPDSITLNFPANCSRPITDIAVLFSENYAPSWLNGFRLYNCSSSQLAGGCVIPASLLQSQSDAHLCDDAGTLNTSCYAAQDRGSGILNYDDIRLSGCRTLLSSFVVKSTSDGALVSDVSLEFQAMQLTWWLPGQCQCSDQADCAAGMSVNGSEGFRCQCRAGFSGDGFIRGNGCQRDPKKGSDVAALVGGIIVGASALVILVVICYYIRKRTISIRGQRSAKRLLSEASGTSHVRIYPYKEIERATAGFSEKQRLGMGAYGTVYAGKLHNEEWVAIKRIKHRDTDSIELVMNEIKLLSSVSHPNLVQLLGCCIEHGEQILVYEYMPHGTLSQHLQREQCEALPWPVRVNIATETAQAIAYLHSVVNPPIYHRDIKSSNILLGDNYQSKVADFGLSRLGMIELSTMSHISTAPQGTPGYVDPQYHQNFHLSDKSDVYSFGVVLVEILTAMKVVDFSRPHTEVNLAAMAVDRIGKGRLDEILDPYLDLTRDAWTLSSVNKVAELAFQCLAYHKDMRPTMLEVADELERIRLTGFTSYDDINMCIGSVASSCGSSPSTRSLDSLSFKKAREVASRRLFVPPKMAGDGLAPLAEVKESSPVSVQEGWLSEQSSPSATSLLSNIGV